MNGRDIQGSPAGAGVATAPSPALFFQAVHGLYQSYALKAAIELEIFTAIAEGAGTVDAIAERCQASPRGVRILCDYLTIIGFLTKQGDRYAATPDTAMFLNRQSPAYVGSAVEFLMSEPHIDSMRQLTETVRTGTTNDRALQPDQLTWVTFARSMAPLMFMPAKMMADFLRVADAGPMRVLDIAAGHGRFGLAVAAANAGAEITAVDWAPVLEVAKENAAAAGVSARYRTIPGSALTVDLGSGYDLVLLPNFLHHFDEATCMTILTKMHGALKPGGRIAVLEFVPNEDRISPPMAATFSLTMLASTPAGDAYTFDQLRTMLSKAGLGRIERYDLPTGMSTVVTGTK
jgi:2-polyprenyl-3-methyl-5-hydroxy-6-metoxy-1,4-benzoquinol methylase